MPRHPLSTGPGRSADRSREGPDPSAASGDPVTGEIGADRPSFDSACRRRTGLLRPVGGSPPRCGRRGGPLWVRPPFARACADPEHIRRSRGLRTAPCTNPPSARFLRRPSPPTRPARSVRHPRHDQPPRRPSARPARRAISRQPLHHPPSARPRHPRHRPAPPRPLRAGPQHRPARRAISRQPLHHPPSARPVRHPRHRPAPPRPLRVGPQHRPARRAISRQPLHHPPSARPACRPRL